MAISSVVTAALKHVTPTSKPDRPKRPPMIRETARLSDSALAEYREVADAIGFAPAALAIEAFRAFLIAKDLPTFELSAVRAYMDALTARENPSELGWHWRPLRQADLKLAVEHKLTFGTPSVLDYSGASSLQQVSLEELAMRQAYERQMQINQLGLQAGLAQSHVGMAAQMQAWPTPQARQTPSSDYFH